MFKFAFHPDIFCPFRRSFSRWQISSHFIIRLAGENKSLCTLCSRLSFIRQLLSVQSFILRVANIISIHSKISRQNKSLFTLCSRLPFIRQLLSVQAFIQRVANIISIHSKIRDINSFNSSCYIEIKMPSTF